MTLRSRTRWALQRAVQHLGPDPADLPMSTWRLDRSGAGALTLDGHALESLLQRFGSPLHIVTGALLKENAARFTARPRDSVRACEVFYSYKTNPVPGVLSALHALGLGAEVTSPYELWLARRLGVAPEKIVYNGPAKTLDSVREAIAMEVGLFNLNTVEEIAPVATLACSLGKRLRVGIRVGLPGAIAGQFGELVDDGSALHAYREAVKYPSLEVIGMHAHLNKEISSQRHLDGFLAAMVRFTDELNERLGLSLQVLDLGGNLACPTVSSRSPLATRLELAFGREGPHRSPETVLRIDDYVTSVVNTIEGHFRRQRRPAPRVFLEPGRALTSSSQMLLCRVAAVRESNGSRPSFAVLDGGINVAEPMRSEHHHLFQLAQTPGARLRTYRLSGPSCTLGDLLYQARSLAQLRVGDGLAIMDSGAYFVPYSTCFSFPRPAVVMVDGSDVRIFRRAETFEDLVALDEGVAARTDEALPPDGVAVPA